MKQNAFKHWLAVLITLIIGSRTSRTNGMNSDSLAASYNEFGFDVLKRLTGGHAGTNLVISPYSAACALALASDAADGETRSEIARVLHWDGREPAQFSEANRQAVAALDTVSGNMILEIANSLWFDSTLKVRGDFFKSLRGDPHNFVSSIDFGKPEAAATINNWCREHTHGWIPGMVGGALPFNLQMLLLNAVYFKGDWEDKFEPTMTSPGPFATGDGQRHDCLMMRRTGHFQYKETQEFQSVYLPYASGGAGMYVFLPKVIPGATLALGEGRTYVRHEGLPGAGLFSLLKTLDPGQWKSLTQGFSSRYGTVSLPKMRLENTHDLTETLQALGMRRAFSPLAEFSRALEDSIHLDGATQKTFLDVNETGTEAAAATGLISLGIEENEFSMAVDHPFLLAIVDSRTDMILFFGSIWNPA